MGETKTSQTEGQLNWTVYDIIFYSNNKFNY